jgi:hypothetical protein
MDLGTIKRKLSARVYSCAQEAIDDIALMFRNCFTFNREGEV